MRFWCAVIYLLCGAACAGRAMPPTDASRVGVADASRGSSVLRGYMDGVALALEGEGFRSGAIKLELFLPQGARHAEPLNVAAQTCIALVAIASAAVVDLDAGLYTTEGEALVEDENVDARPMLSLCSGAEPRTLYYTLHAYQGGGAVHARAFMRPQSAGDRALPATASANLGEWSALSERLKARGFSGDGPATDLTLSAGDALRVAIPVASGSCYTWIGEAERALGGVSMRVLDASGRELARGEDDGGPLALQLCAERTNELVLIVSAATGHGTLRLSRFRGPEARVGGASALWLGEPLPRSGS